MADPSPAYPGEKEDAINHDLPDPTNTLLTRLESWKHVFEMLDNYLDINITLQKNISNTLEKAKKTVANEPRFDYSPLNVIAQNDPTTADTPTSPTNTSGPKPYSYDPNVAEQVIGVAESFATIRVTTDDLFNKSVASEQSLKNNAVPLIQTIREDLDKQIKSLKSGGIKILKDVEKSRNATFKDIESLKAGVKNFGVASNVRPDYKSDPYVLHRHVKNSLEEQVAKENLLIDALVSLQKNFQSFESHMVQVLQQVTFQISQNVGNFAEAEKEGHTKISTAFSLVPGDYEWKEFSARNAGVILPEGTPHRNLANITFENSDNQVATPLIEGILQRKEGKLIKSYASSYYVITPSRYLFGYDSQDHVQHRSPDFTVYLPEATLGAPSPRESGKSKFQIQAKNLSSTISTKHNYQFKTSTYDEMLSWHEIIKNSIGMATPASLVAASPATSPIETFPPAVAAALPAVAPAGAPAAAPGTAPTA